MSMSKEEFIEKLEGLQKLPNTVTITPAHKFDFYSWLENQEDPNQVKSELAFMLDTCKSEWHSCQDKGPLLNYFILTEMRLLDIKFEFADGEPIDLANPESYVHLDLPEAEKQALLELRPKENEDDNFRGALIKSNVIIKTTELGKEILQEFLKEDSSVITKFQNRLALVKKYKKFCESDASGILVKEIVKKIKSFARRFKEDDLTDSYGIREFIRELLRLKDEGLSEPMISYFCLLLTNKVDSESLKDLLLNSIVNLAKDENTNDPE